MPVGPLAGEAFPPGTCLLSGLAASGGTARIAYSYMQPGVEWASGEKTDGEPAIVDSAEESRGEHGRPLCLSLLH